MRLLLVCVAVASATALELSTLRDPCRSVECRAGRECVVQHGVAECQCARSCPHRVAPVCGSDDNTYDNHCLLHRQACLTGEHIKVRSKGVCKKNKKIKIKPVEKEDPAVCYSSQRDAFLLVVGKHWQDTLAQQPWHVAGMTYREGLWGRFFTCDTNSDNYLDSDELLNCTSKARFRPRPEQDQELTRALCVDAMVDMGDTNRDWRLDFEEFTVMFSPGYHPPQKMCSLEGSKYLDGEDVHVDGSHCVCAVGSWVCTSPDSKTDKNTFKPLDFNYSENELEKDNDLFGEYEELLNDVDSNNDEEFLINEDEDEDYLEDLFDEMLDKLHNHRKQRQHHHNHL